MIIASPVRYFNEVLPFISGTRSRSKGGLSLHAYVFCIRLLPDCTYDSGKNECRHRHPEGLPTRNCCHILYRDIAISKFPLEPIGLLMTPSLKRLMRFRKNLMVSSWIKVRHHDKKKV